ncbi:hypothetical protein [Glutamicibacter uratoxydans]
MATREERAGKATAVRMASGLRGGQVLDEGQSLYPIRGHVIL